MAFLVVGVVATVVQGGLIGPLVGRCGEHRLILAVGLVVVGCLLLSLATAAIAQPLVFVAVALWPGHRPGHPLPAKPGVTPAGGGWPGGRPRQPAGPAEPGQLHRPTAGGTGLRPGGRNSPVLAGIALFLLVALLLSEGSAGALRRPGQQP